MNTALSRRVFLGATGSAAMGIALSACSGPQGAGSAGGGKLTGPITFWTGYPTTDSNDKSKTPQQFWIYQAAQRFTKKTGVQVKIEQLPGDATMFTKIRTAAIGGGGPDVANVWSGSYALGIKSFLEPMGQYFNSNDMSQLSGWAAVSDGFDPRKKDTLFGVPDGTDGAQVLMFDKRVLAKAGVDPSTWPTTYDAWVAQLDKIKASGITPLSLGQNALPFILFDTWLAQVVGGSAGIFALSTGKRKFSDPAILDVAKKVVALRPYALPGAASTTDDQAFQQLLAGKAAMALGGAGGTFELQQRFKGNGGLAKLPNVAANGIQGGTVGGAGVAFIVLKNSKHKESAVAFIKHLLSASEQRRFAASKDPGPLVGRTDAKDYYTDPLINQLQQWSTDAANTFWPDNTFPADLVNELGAQMQLLWNGSISPSQFLARLDAKRDSLKP
ncbi:ABC transporter substrate-binding protein [Amnibacterium sp. CER49]|uniref:ABC transporter substrate-binding protein n=1 Tax=Amnibacterium sp. CER49 TaxID=3039161 RepID=UPI00244782CE|nr:ABC transporter substrate-binding protein [Amnibacterium sp. CER49]MDH2442853.1 ABC transporter substrate-binding protein [Amnibacterium sp. CER49]